MALKFVLFGAGYWARYQLAAWREIDGVECVAICDPVLERARALADRFNVPRVYSDAAEMLRRESPDFADIVSSNDTHAALTELCATHRVPVICQKPMAPTLDECERMIASCARAGVPLLVHENWRWQAPIRALKTKLASGVIGDVARAELRVITAANDFDNQPFLKEAERMVIADMGVHLLDVARFLFGEASSVYCHAVRVQPDIRGEDMATVILRCERAATVLIRLAFARIPMERDYYVQTFATVEGRLGTIELIPDYWIRTTTSTGTSATQHVPPHYAWSDPVIAACMASIVDCHQNLLGELTGRDRAETTAEDNLKSMRLMEACYHSASTGQCVAP